MYNEMKKLYRKGYYLRTKNPNLPTDDDNEWNVETITIPSDDFFEDHMFLDPELDPYWFHVCYEYYADFPMLEVSSRGNQIRVSICKEHEDERITQQRVIARLAIKWKMQVLRKAIGIPDDELKKGLTDDEIVILENYRRELIKEGLQPPPGRIAKKAYVDLDNLTFSSFALDKMTDRKVTEEAVKCWIDTSIIMRKDGRRHLYISFDGNVAIEVLDNEVTTVYPNTSPGNINRQLMQKALSLINDRFQYRQLMQKVTSIIKNRLDRLY